MFYVVCLYMYMSKFKNVKTPVHPPYNNSALPESCLDEYALDIKSADVQI